MKAHAERKAGEIIAGLPKGQGSRTDKLSGTLPRSSKTSRLAEVSLDRKAAKRLQDMARVPEAVFAEKTDADALTEANVEII